MSDNKVILFFRKHKYLIIAILLLVIFFSITRALISMDQSEKRKYDGLKEEADYNYPLSGLFDEYYYTDEYYFRSYDDGNITSKRGIDVSEHQGQIDWAMVKEAGVQFAFIRCGYRTLDLGNLREDARFHENIQGAIDNGIDVGVYFFSQAISVDEAMDEAVYAVELVKGYDLSLPIVYDMEETLDSSSRIEELTLTQRTEFADAFCTVVENYGYDSMVYGNPTWLLTKINLLQLKDRKIWLANYADSTAYPFRYEIWQYSDSGWVDGVDTPVDLNIMFIR